MGAAGDRGVAAAAGVSVDPDAIRSAYLAAPGFEAEIEDWLALDGARVAAWHGRLALSTEPPLPCPWAMNRWLEPRAVRIASVGDAAQALRGIQRSWTATGPLHTGRMALIEERLPTVRRRLLRFPEALPSAPLGSFTLLEPGLMLASARCSAALPDGEIGFEEDREGPPSRAYLKLWEALTLAGAWPSPGDLAVDLGASPGGWSWALARLGCRVVAVDKAPLDRRVAAMPGVEWRSESAFGLDPRSFREREGRPVDWLCSDIVAYPARLLRLVEAWREAGVARRVVCTVKFQGQTDHEAARAFQAIPGGRLLHLSHNKHELTFLWVPGGSIG